MRSKFKVWLRRFLLSLLDVPSLEEFDEGDMKQIDDWLSSNVTHNGFIKYVKARDRAFVQTMMKSPIETESDRHAYYVLEGRRLENARLMARATAVSEARSKKVR
jgi:hypothetical protein